jgi:hypothetical protein
VRKEGKSKKLKKKKETKNQERRQRAKRRRKCGGQRESNPSQPGFIANKHTNK